MNQTRVCETNVLTGNVQHFVEKEIITSCCDSVSHSINLETESPTRSHYSAGGTCNILVHIHLYIYTVEIYIATHIRTSFEPSDMSLWHTHTTTSMKILNWFHCWICANFAQHQVVHELGNIAIIGDWIERTIYRSKFHTATPFIRFSMKFREIYVWVRLIHIRKVETKDQFQVKLLELRYS